MERERCHNVLKRSKCLIVSCSYNIILVPARWCIFLPRVHSGCHFWDKCFPLGKLVSTLTYTRFGGTAARCRAASLLCWGQRPVVLWSDFHVATGDKRGLYTVSCGVMEHILLAEIVCTSFVVVHLHLHAKIINTFRVMEVILFLA